MLWPKTGLTNFFSLCFPQRYLWKRYNLPWLTKNIVQLIQKCNILFKKAKRSGKLDHFHKYKTRLYVSYAIGRSSILAIWLMLSLVKKCSENLLDCSIKTRNLFHLLTPMASQFLMTCGKLKFSISLLVVGTLKNSPQQKKPTVIHHLRMLP